MCDKHFTNTYVKLNAVLRIKRGVSEDKRQILQFCTRRLNWTEWELVRCAVH